MNDIPAGCQYTSKTTFVDADTGEILRRENAINPDKYIIIKTHKKTTYNANKTIGNIEYTRECRRQPQTKLPFDWKRTYRKHTVLYNKTRQPLVHSNGTLQNNWIAIHQTRSIRPTRNKQMAHNNEHDRKRNRKRQRTNSTKSIQPRIQSKTKNGVNRKGEIYREKSVPHIAGFFIYSHRQ